MKYIELTQGKRAMVDDEDFEVLNKYKWYVEKKRGGQVYYAGRSNGVGNDYMHRVIKNVPNGMFTDHVNGNGLDNRKENLCICTNAENLRNRTRLPENNTSGTLGVTWVKTNNKWRAQAMRNYKNVHLGYFSDKKEAIECRMNFIKKEHVTS
jgi:hypothetical protein